MFVQSSSPVPNQTLTAPKPSNEQNSPGQEAVTARWIGQETGKTHASARKLTILSKTDGQENNINKLLTIHTFNGSVSSLLHVNICSD
jgi:hypothetical protein